ncbi:hypothetical protein H7F49_13450 [Novosphingobium flavum]|uniref:Uncharacterized protein n=1 Tax=Novosphingobium aerophilum TaxID=2839843 RepID=A0A7X1KD23_9SPHN|nr:hypothetical protein [Novosphingobium aerophilum]
MEAAPDQTSEPADTAADAAAAPSPDPMTRMILADLVLRGGGALMRRAVEQNLLGRTLGKGKAQKIIKGRTMGQTLLGTAVARIATRSVPGAIIVGGGLLAKALYDRKKGKKG